ncbi:VIT family protein [Hirsutella rhossiliensis]|uniref:VIT family domain-containing protein n=1 Tax=Hirsutella rhossiliensis TaxID=111463 RepID=A0A9P8MXY4_9HYPO|nr:VIT family domain-containing protein [Hirsutella rhossiliensis]KAH0963310.1 VIT family domain-containing protein [Hirsutella rhossiliensis]
MAKSRSPCFTRFLSDFTLGFSDGLTVPFALTAGLSSLGRADTVIYAGVAELCAGCISMGIGGYLSAVDELPPPPSRRGTLRDDDEELIGDEEKGLDELLVRRHLEPLALPGATVSDIVTALRRHPDGLARAAHQLQQRQRPHEQLPVAPGKPLPLWPVASGLSISLGYVVGGVIPLLPYLFTPTVGLGLGWSIGLCLLALMTFGFGKTWLLRGEDATWRRCLLQGFQMLILGSLAAGASVLFVNLMGGSGHAESAG